MAAAFSGAISFLLGTVAVAYTGGKMMPPEIFPSRLLSLTGFKEKEKFFSPQHDFSHRRQSISCEL